MEYISCQSWPGAVWLLARGWGIGYGGAIFSGSSPLIVSVCQFEDNTGGLGGAISKSAGTLNISDSTFDTNSSTGDNSDMYGHSGALYLTGNTFNIMSMIGIVISVPLS